MLVCCMAYFYRLLDGFVVAPLDRAGREINIQSETRVQQALSKLVAVSTQSASQPQASAKSGRISVTLKWPK